MHSELRDLVGKRVVVITQPIDGAEDNLIESGILTENEGVYSVGELMPFEADEVIAIYEWVSVAITGAINPSTIPLAVVMVK